MVSLARAASLAKTFGVAYCRARFVPVGHPGRRVTRRTRMAEAELSVRPRDSKTTRPDGGTPVASFRLVEISLRAVGSPPEATSESSQLPARRALAPRCRLPAGSQLGEWSRSPASGFTLIELT